VGIKLNHNLALELPDSLHQHAVEQNDPRAELAAQFVPAGARVLDFSRVNTLERHLPHGCVYTHTEKLDAFPQDAASRFDLIVMLGMLERAADTDELFAHLRTAQRDVILSYCASDLAARTDQSEARRVKSLSFYELTLLFDRYDFRIACTAPLGEREMLMRLTPRMRLRAVETCRVAVIADEEMDGFSARFGRQMINALLPGEAEVHHLNCRSLHEAHERYDLAIIGVGNGLFQPLYGDALLDITSRAKAAIGIFGTQYRELIPRAGMDRLVDRLDAWFARNQDDVLMYGRDRAHVSHLGEWLIDLFPLAQASDDTPLEIGEEVDEDLDRAIALIQKHKQVYSRAAQPLLCALTSADMVAYADEPSGRMLTPSGHFRSMLIDIFGRSYPQKQFFLVDRDAVARYKAQVHKNMAELRARIEATLRNVAVAAV
jgi:hypothetical protein